MHTKNFSAFCWKAISSPQHKVGDAQTKPDIKTPDRRGSIWNLWAEYQKEGNSTEREFQKAP